MGVNEGRFEKMVKLNLAGVIQQKIILVGIISRVRPVKPGRDMRIPTVFICILLGDHCMFGPEVHGQEEHCPHIL